MLVFFATAHCRKIRLKREERPSMRTMPAMPVRLSSNCARGGKREKNALPCLLDQEGTMLWVIK
jgi:hypothetical protein